MMFYSLFCIVVQFYIGTSVEIRPKLQRNILNFGYGINYKYEGMLTQSFDRFYVVTKFMLPTIEDLKVSKLNFNDSCAHMENKFAQNTESRKYIVTQRYLYHSGPRYTGVDQTFNWAWLA